jgi:hypothetical protein
MGKPGDMISPLVLLEITPPQSISNVACSTRTRLGKKTLTDSVYINRYSTNKHCRNT